MTQQWHPVFARLLRQLLEVHYEVQTNVPVSDTPRQADIVLLRRTSTGPLPFQGLWKHLTTWNILEFKGPSVSARVGDLDLLLEVGLGIQRRLEEERRRQGQTLIARGEVSLWYLANHLGRRFLHELRGIMGRLDDLGPGLWQGQVWKRPVYLVSGSDVPVEPDSLPLHILGPGTVGEQRQVAEYLTGSPALWQRYSGWLATLHPELWEEIRDMGKTRGKKFGFHLQPVISEVGLKNVIAEVGLKNVVAEVGLKNVVAEVGLKNVVAEVGLKNVIAEVGLKNVIAEVGAERVIAEMGLPWFLAQLTSNQRRELKRLLEQ
jgi:hypothetical protein